MPMFFFVFFLGWIECVISDPVCLLASMTAVCFILHQMATWGAKILLGALAEGRVTQTKRKADILSHLILEYPTDVLFFKEKCM